MSKHEHRRVSMAHQGVDTSLPSSREGDSFTRFCDRQRSRIRYASQKHVRSYRRRTLNLRSDKDEIELRGSCGSDFHEDHEKESADE